MAFEGMEECTAEDRGAAREQRGGSSLGRPTLNCRPENWWTWLRTEKSGDIFEQSHGTRPDIRQMGHKSSYFNVFAIKSKIYNN